MSSFSAENDIEAILAAPINHIAIKVGMGRQSVLETGALIAHIGKVVMDIGEGLTLLHLAAQFNRVDLIEYLCDMGHPLEV